jgi:hypothetical protein
MAATITWFVQDLRRETTNDGITLVRWGCHGVEVVDGVKINTTEFGKTHHTPDPDASDFIAYASVAEADVLGWVHAAVDKDAIEAKVQADVNAKKTPTSATGLPWAAE